jgi:hypothetical protein
MFRMLRTLTVAMVCTLLLAGGALGDGENGGEQGDPSDPHGGTIATRDQTVLPDVSPPLVLIQWLVPWVIR